MASLPHPEDFPAIRQYGLAVVLAVHRGDYEGAEALVCGAEPDELRAALVYVAELADAGWRSAARSPDDLDEAYERYALRLAGG